MIQILCKNTKKTGNFKFGTSIFEIYNKLLHNEQYELLGHYLVPNIQQMV